MLYGYSTKTLNENGLLEMKEVTISASSDDLRQIAKFFYQMADDIDNGSLKDCSHRHIGNVIQGWDKKFPGSDIIVMPVQ